MGIYSRYFIPMIILFFLIGIVACSNDSETISDAKNVSYEVCEEWLSLLDQEMYEKSWTETAEFFRNTVPQKEWVRVLRAVRTPFGNVIQRKRKSSDYLTSLPGAPDGEYIVMKFSTSFEQKKESEETITASKNTEGKWEVVGYFIK